MSQRSPEDSSGDGAPGGGSPDPDRRANGAGGDAERRVPDAAAPEAALDNGMFSEELFGVEAAVPPGDYGPPIYSKLPDPTRVRSEIRELDRRVKARLTPLFPMEERRRMPLEFLWKRYRRFAMRDRSEVVDAFGRDPAYRARMEPALDFLYRRYFRVAIDGIERVPDHGRALLVANHSGTLPWDTVILMHALANEHPARRDLRPLIEDAIFHFPYLGVAVNRLGGVRACQENATRLLEDDQLVAVFPEGLKGLGKLFRDRYRLQRFGRGGFVKLALRTGAPIVPVAVIGAEETSPMLAKVTWFTRSIGLPYLPITPTFPLLGPAGLLPLPSKWRLRFGEVLDFSAEHGPDAAEDRLLVHRLAEEVRGRIQGLIDESLAERESVLFG